MTPLFSPDVLAKMQKSLGVPSSFIEELVRIYLSDSPALLDSIEQHVAEMNFESLVRSAHSLKSSSAALGALKLAEVCREIEMTDKANLCWPVLKAKGLEARALFKQTCEALKNTQATFKKSA